MLAKFPADIAFAPIFCPAEAGTDVEFTMRIVVGTLGAIMIVALGALPVAAATAPQTPPGTIRFAIMRNGEQIGTHAIEISRTGPETNVRITTDLSVKVLFVTAYRLQHSAAERWVNGQLVAFSSTTDDMARAIRSTP